jgi:hypothetical protein
MFPIEGGRVYDRIGGIEKGDFKFSDQWLLSRNSLSFIIITPNPILSCLEYPQNSLGNKVNSLNYFA